MTWTPITREQIHFGQQVITWIRTARAAGYVHDNWLPSAADFQKSALLERLRSGKDPLPEPPPTTYSCPHYALVEDPGPHVVGYAHEDVSIKEDKLFACQHRFIITEFIDTELEFYQVRDGGHETSYRFIVWWDEDYRAPAWQKSGAWLMQNKEFFGSYRTREELEKGK